MIFIEDTCEREKLLEPSVLDNDAVLRGCPDGISLDAEADNEAVLRGQTDGGRHMLPATPPSRH